MLLNLPNQLYGTNVPKCSTNKHQFLGSFLFRWRLSIINVLKHSLSLTHTHTHTRKHQTSICCSVVQIHFGALCGFSPACGFNMCLSFPTKRSPHTEGEKYLRFNFP